jgi:hypothetical protein
MILIQAFLNDLKKLYIKKLQEYENDRKIEVISIFDTIDLNLINQYREKYPQFPKNYENVSEYVLLNFVQYIVDKSFIDISDTEFNSIFNYNPDMIL